MSGKKQKPKQKKTTDPTKPPATKKMKTSTNIPPSLPPPQTKPISNESMNLDEEIEVKILFRTFIN